MAEFHGVMHISSVLKKHGHTCDVLISSDISEITAFIKVQKPDIVGFSLMSGVHQWALMMAAGIKKVFPELKIVFGGVHPTYFPEIIEKDPVDIICRGEGEYSALDLMNALEQGKTYTHIKNLWVKEDGRIYQNEMRPLIENLDNLPYPDHDLYYDRYPFLKDRSVKNFIVVRGCPYDCSFCYNKKLKHMYKGKGRYVRYRSKESIIEEIKDLKKRYDFKRIYFVADTMFVDKKWAVDFLKYYKEKLGIPFSAVIRADRMDENVARGLKEANCKATWFGIESGNEHYRNEILKKSLTDKQIIQAAFLLKKYGIKFRTYNMLCLPGETIEQAYDTVNINIKIKTDYPWCSIYTPYFGTELVDYAQNMGYLDPKFNIDCIDASYFKETHLKGNHVREMLNLQRFFQTAILLPWTLPLIKKLVKLPPNLFFNLWFQLIYVLLYIRSEGHGLWETLKFSLHYSKIYYRKNPEKSIRKEP